MKTIALLFAVAACVPVLAGDTPTPAKPAPVQEAPALPATSPADPGEKGIPLGEPRPFPEPAPSLLPEMILPAPKPALPAARRNSAILRPPTTSADLDMRIRYRKARNVAESDKAVQTAWNQSRAAKTDLAKRQALKRYYDALLARVLAIDKGLAPFVEQRRKSDGVALDQLRIAPTGSLE